MKYIIITQCCCSFSKLPLWEFSDVPDVESTCCEFLWTMLVFVLRAYWWLWAIWRPSATKSPPVGGVRDFMALIPSSTKSLFQPCYMESNWAIISRKKPRNFPPKHRKIWSSLHVWPQDGQRVETLTTSDLFNTDVLKIQHFHVRCLPLAVKSYKILENKQEFSRQLPFLLLNREIFECFLQCDVHTLNQ